MVTMPPGLNHDRIKLCRFSLGLTLRWSQMRLHFRHQLTNVAIENTV
jgi:hypothetical protein